MNYVGKPLAYILATPERVITATRCVSRSATRPVTGTSRSSPVASTASSGTVSGRRRTPSSSRGRLPGRFDRQGVPGRGDLSPDTLRECDVAVLDENGALLNRDAAVGELVNTSGGGLFQGYYKGTTPPISG